MTDVRAQEIQTDYSHDKFLTRYRTYPVKISENLTGAVSEQEALTSWLKSASHSATLHKDYQYSCISCLNNLCVQIFSDF